MEKEQASQEVCTACAESTPRGLDAALEGRIAEVELAINGKHASLGRRGAVPRVCISIWGSGGHSPASGGTTVDDIFQAVSLLFVLESVFTNDMHCVTTHFLFCPC